MKAAAEPPHSKIKKDIMDWIGFAISLIALIFLYFKNRAAENSKKNEEEVRLEEPMDNPLHEFLEAIEEREKKKERHTIPTPPPVIKKKRERLDERHLISPLQNKKIISETEKRQLASPLKNRYLRSNFTPVIEQEKLQGPTRGQLALNRLQFKQDLLIYHEVFGKPKSLE